MRRTGIITVLVVAALVGCSSGRDMAMPAAEEIAEPTFQTLPDDLADSPQLAALVERDTAGLEPTSPTAAGALLPEALAALAVLDPAPAELSRLSIYADSVYFSFVDDGITGRSVTAVYRSADDFSVSDPSYDDSETYPISAIQADVPQRLIDAIQTRFPSSRVTSLDFEPGRSYDFGLVWNVGVEDARGSLATVFADPDGAIVAVDMD